MDTRIVNARRLKLLTEKDLQSINTDEQTENTAIVDSALSNFLETIPERVSVNFQPIDSSTPEFHDQSNLRRSNRKTKAPIRDDTVDLDMLSAEDHDAIFNN